jgi:chloramphenicol-sensitive protein RarD
MDLTCDREYNFACLAACRTASNRSDESVNQDRRGLAFGVAAYAFWGAVPLYWHFLRGIDPVEILAHRTVWGLLAFVGFSAWLGTFPAMRRAAREPRTVRVLLLSGACLLVNWGVFIYAVSTERVLHASLGYFINPLISVLLGMVVLRERLRPLQWVAMALALAGVVQLAAQTGGVPWIALVLAGSFGAYGLLRKTAPVEALAGSTLETAFMAPLGALYLATVQFKGASAFLSGSPITDALLVSTGFVTAVPLVWFTAAARRLPLATVGFLQYLAPTGQFLCAVLAFHEPFAGRELAAFGFIWAALAVFTVDLFRARVVPA